MSITNFFNIKNNYKTDEHVKSDLIYGKVSDKPVLISIIMPVYKHPDFLEYALVSAVKQDFKYSYEIVVVDDDDSVSAENSRNYEVVKEQNSQLVRYYKNKRNLGLCGNWNRSILLAKGKYVVFCHDDERLESNALTCLYKLSQKIDPNSAIFPNKNSEYLDGTFRKYDSEKRMLGLFRKRELHKAGYSYFLDRTLGNGAGALLNRKCVLKIGGYNPEYYPCSDFALNIVYAYKYGAFRTRYALITSRQGENLSYECYSDFAPRMKEIRYCLKPLTKLNNRLFDYLVEVKYRTSKDSFDMAFGGKSRNICNTASLSDRVVNRLFSYYINFKHYI